VSVFAACAFLDSERNDAFRWLGVPWKGDNAQFRIRKHTGERKANLSVTASLSVEIVAVSRVAASPFIAYSVRRDDLRRKDFARIR
jgi:hypothetical protein